MRRPATAAAALLCTAALGLGVSGCATRLDAQTYKGRDQADRVRADLNGLALRGLSLAVDPADATAPAELSGIVVNDSTQADSLTGASSAAADAVTLTAPVDLPPSSGAGTPISLQLTGLKGTVRPGSYVEVQLDFAKAGQTTIKVPVRAKDDASDLASRQPEQDPYAPEPAAG